MADKANEKAKEAATGTTLDSSVQDNTPASTEPTSAQPAVQPELVVVAKPAPVVVPTKLDEVPEGQKPRYQRDGRWYDPDGKDLGPVKEGE